MGLTNTRVTRFLTIKLDDRCSGTIHISLYHGHYNFSRDDGAGSYTNVRRPRGDSPARLQPPFARKETRGSPVVDLGKKNEEKTIDFRRIYVLLHSSWLYKATCKTVYGCIWFIYITIIFWLPVR